MKAIMIMYDSLNLKMLEPYGCDFIKMPNFKRLQEKAITFDKNYVGSLPCMPARRELHTGRYNFLHRSWGPIEPFDDSMPEILRNNGIHSHLISDHQHYWEDGGATYHTRYSSWEISRGQEGDPWKNYLEDNQKKDYTDMHIRDEMNRRYIGKDESKMPQSVTFNLGLEFLENNHDQDNWFLQIETFDPHEPFFSQDEYKKIFKHEYNGTMKDWPPYYFVTEGDDAVEHIRYEYAALLIMCDRYIGKVLDVMDKYNLWEDTMLIVNTDHGYLIGEHDWWSKGIMPTYNEMANTPLFIYDPVSKIKAERRNFLTQTIDIPATLLDFFGLAKPRDMLGMSMLPLIRENKVTRDYALFGYHEGHVNITDGKYVYMLAPSDNVKIYNYTLMPTHMRCLFSIEELKQLELQEPFKFTKGVKTMKIPAAADKVDAGNYGTRLYNLEKDPLQKNLIIDYEKEAELVNETIKIFIENDAPKEKYDRYRLERSPCVDSKKAREMREKEEVGRIPDILTNNKWQKSAVNMYHALMRYVPSGSIHSIKTTLVNNVKDKEVSEIDVLDAIQECVPQKSLEIVKYKVILNSKTN
ncbi:MAG: sulfatase [Lachnospirales bacterium]